MQTLKELKNWCENSFIKRNGGFLPKDLDKWYDSVNKSHEKSREFLKGNLIEEKFNVDGEQKPLDLEKNKDLIEKIKDLIPEFLRTYGYTDEIFKYPNISSGNHNSIRLTKAISAYARDLYSSTSVTRSLDKLISNLGEEWAKNKTSKQEIAVTLSTTHKGFMLLGHYGPDYDSCWRQGSDKTRHKYAFAQSKDTFVITMARFEPKVNKKINIARCVGFFNQQFNTINLMNYYFLPGFLEGDGLNAIELIAKKIFDKPVNFVEGFVLCDGGIWHNPYGNWSFSTNKKSMLETQVLESNFKDIDQLKCEICGIRVGSPNDISTVDEQRVCYRCYDKAKRCGISNLLTFKPLVSVVNDYGDIILALPEVIQTFESCEKCGMKARSLIGVEESLYCQRCLNIYCSHCDGCGKNVESNDLEEAEDGSYCTECALNPQDAALNL